MPQIVVMLDNWVSFRGYYPEYEDMFISISRESVSLGICLIVTAAQASGAGFKLLANFSTRTALYCNDSGDYSSIFESCRKKIANLSLYRYMSLAQFLSIVENNKTFYECQYYLAFAAEKEFEKIALIKEYIEEVKAKYGNVSVKGIPEIPEHLTESFLYRQYGEKAFAPYEVPLGMEFNSIDKRTFRLDKVGYMAFLGAPDSGKNSYITYLVRTILARNNVAPVDIYIVDNIDKSLGEFESMVAAYTCSIDGMGQILNNVLDILTQKTMKLQLIVINSGSLLKTLSADKNLVAVYKKIITEFKDQSVCFLYTDVLNEAISFTGGDVLKSIKEKKQLVAFENLKNLKVVDVSAVAAREFKKPLEGMDAYYFVNDGTSTPDWVIEEVVKTMADILNDGIEKIRTLCD